MIDDGGSYWISGETITVGSGGIIASGNSLISNTDVEAPIALSAPQTWSVAGNDRISLRRTSRAPQMPSMPTSANRRFSSSPAMLSLARHGRGQRRN